MPEVQSDPGAVGTAAPPGAGPLGVVAFSFGMRAVDEEPNPSNVALAAVVRAVVEASSRPAVVVAQWEVASQLTRDGIPVAAQVELRPGRYLDSTGVWEEARAVLAERGVVEVVPVAHPFLHQRYVAGLVRADGFTVLAPPRLAVPFDRSAANTQWWTRSRPALAVYSLGKRVPAARRVLSPLVGAWPG